MQQIVISPFHWLLEPHCAHTTALSFNSSSSPLLLRRLPQQHGGSSPGSGASPAQTPPFSRQSSLAAGPGRRAALSSQESALWAIPFEQLELEEKIGEGAFGRVRPLVVVSYFFTSCWERGQGAQAQVGRGPLLNGRGGMAVPKGRRVACVPSLYAVPQVYRAEWHATPVAVKVLLAQAQLQDTGSLAEALAQPSPVLTRLQEVRRRRWWMWQWRCGCRPPGGGRGGVGAGAGAAVGAGAGAFLPRRSRCGRRAQR
jgi:hypothetical protein